jgi:4'-phosphopantetheinyl transferase gsp
MLAIYYFNIKKINNSLTEELYKRFYHDRSISHKKIEIDLIRSMLGRAILHYALKSTFGKCFEKNISLSNMGKPYLIDGPHFNISHSGSFVLCAVSDFNVGIDIEKQTEYRDEFLSHFHEMEIKNIIDNLSNSRRINFYELWVLKESYLKYLGTGLYKSLDSFYVAPLEKNQFQIFENDFNNPKCKLQLFTLDCEYSSAVCYETEKIDFIIECKVSNLIE